MEADNLEDRKLIQRLFLVVCTVGASLAGSPPPRVPLVGFLAMSHVLLGHISNERWEQSLFTVSCIGPYAELATFYFKYKDSELYHTAEAAADWFDMSGFYMLAIVAMPVLGSLVGMRRRMYKLTMLAMSPAALGYAFVCVPPWAPARLSGQQVRVFMLMCIAQVLSWTAFNEMERIGVATALRQRAHEQYVAALSHDFGTPITAIKMSVARMKEACAHRKGMEHVEPLLSAMSAACEVMSALRQKAIDFGKLQLGRQLTPDMASVNVEELVLVKLAAVMRYIPHSDKVKVSYSVDDAVSRWITTDGSFVFMMLLNFASNAFKATKCGHILVCARLVDRSIRFAVSDTGEGLTAEAAERILWKPFMKLSSSGTGLGLYHVHQLAKALKGSVGYEPNHLASSGSVFWFDLPYASCDAPVAEAFGEPELRKSLFLLPVAVPKGPVLLVEDDEFIQEMTKLLLHDLGVGVVSQATDGREALRMLMAEDAPRFSLVLMDMQMPFMDGPECVRHIRAWERQSSLVPLRIYALSAGDSEQFSSEWREQLDGVLQKPVPRETLQQLLSSGK